MSYSTVHRVSGLFWYEGFPEPPLPIPTPVAECGTWLNTHPEHQSTAPSVRAKGCSWLSLSFWESDFKNSLFIKPQHIDLGFVAGESEHPIAIWSTFTEPLNLKQLTAINTHGLSIDGPPAGTTLPAYGGYIDYTLSVSKQIEVHIDAQWHWQFATEANPQGDQQANVALTVTGTKLVPWPFRPTFPVEEQWQWSTAVIETRQSEQRLANAVKPTQQLTYHFRHLNEQAIDNDARFAMQGRYPLALPLWLNGINAVTANVGDTTLTANITAADFVPNSTEQSLAMLYHGPYDFEMVEVIAATEHQLTLARPLLNHHHNATLLPIRICLSEQGLQSRRAGRDTEQHITFTNTAPLTLDHEEWSTNYLNRPVIRQRMNTDGTSDDVSYPWQSKTTTAGQSLFVLTQEYARHRSELALLETDYRLLQRRLNSFKGQLNSFWWISFHSEITVVDNCTRACLTVARRGFNEHFPDGLHLYLIWADGIQMTKAIPSGFDEKGNELLDIDGDSNIPITPNDFKKGHIMRLMRFAEDSWPFQHNPKTTSIRLPIVEVPPLEREKRESENEG